MRVGLEINKQTKGEKEMANIGKLSSGILAVFCFNLFFMLMADAAWADTTKEIDTRVNNTMKRFYEKVKDGKKLVKEAKGILVFPRVYKAAMGIGGEYGEGALRISGKTVDYYSVSSASFGFQLGADQKAIVILFTDAKVLDNLRTGNGWKAGVDASVTVAKSGDGASMDTRGKSSYGPIVAYVIGRRGLMYDLSLEGTKFEKWPKDK